MSSTQFWEVAGVLLEYAEIVGYVDVSVDVQVDGHVGGSPRNGPKVVFFLPSGLGVEVAT